MVNQDVGQQHLDLYDELNMAEHAERRLKAYTMVDYYCRVISEVSTEYLQIEGDIRTDSLKDQWEQTRTRLQALDDFSVPSEYQKAIYNLHNIRNDVGHNYEKNPSEGKLKHIRDVASEWRGWLIENSQEYDNVQGEFDARKTMIRIAQQSINDIKNQRIPHHEPYASEVETRKARAENLSQKLEKLESGDEISIELVYALLDAKELAQEVDEAIDAGEYVGWALGELGEPGVSPDEVGFEPDSNNRS